MFFSKNLQLNLYLKPSLNCSYFLGKFEPRCSYKEKRVVLSSITCYFNLLAQIVKLLDDSF